MTTHKVYTTDTWRNNPQSIYWYTKNDYYIYK